MHAELFWTQWYIRGATFRAFSKNHDAPPLKLLIGHQLTLGRPLDKAHLAILNPPAGAMIIPNFWYGA